MLFHEITPFATAHRNAIDKLIASLELHRDDSARFTLTHKEVTEIIDVLKTTKRGFDRFEACAIDEWKTKERYIKRLQDAGLYYPGR